MATPPHPGLAAGRRFGLEIGIGCLAVAVYLGARGRNPDLRMALLVAALALCGLAMVRPRWLAPVATRWLAVGERIARVTTPVVLGLIWFLVLTPIGLARRTLGRSPIRRDLAAGSFWVRRPPRTPDARRSAMEHQF